MRRTSLALTSVEVLCSLRVRGETSSTFANNILYSNSTNYLKNFIDSDKTVRLFRWEVGNGFVEDVNSPFLGHKYAVTQTVFSPKVSATSSTVEVKI